jgi:hypothetical protein
MNADTGIPDILLERYRLNELPNDEADRLAALLAHDSRLRERLAALEASDEELRGSGVPDRLEAGARRKLSGKIEPRRRAMYWAVPVVAAAAFIAIAVARISAPLSGGSSAVRSADGPDRIKGLEPALALYRRTAEGSETLADGAVARPGDLIRIGYRPAGHSYGAIVSIDGAGNVTIHLPPTGARAAALKREATVLLDQAYELDDAPGWERFYFVAGDAPFDVGTVIQAARDAAAHRSGTPPGGLSVPRGLAQSHFTLQKESRP